MKFYVYRHVRLDTGLPFYVGKGSGNRAWTKISRNVYWKRIVTRSQIKVEILKTFESEHESYLFEEKLISLYKKHGYCEANLSLGGRGGTSPCEEIRLKISLKNTGLKRSPEIGTLHSIKMSGSNNPMFGKKRTPEEKELMSKNRKGIVSKYRGVPRTSYLKEKLRKAFEKYVYKTPYGEFKSSRLAALSCNCTRGALLNKCKSKKYKDYSRELIWQS